MIVWNDLLGVLHKPAQVPHSWPERTVHFSISSLQTSIQFYICKVDKKLSTTWWNVMIPKSFWKFNYGSLISMTVSFVKWPWLIYCIVLFCIFFLAKQSVSLFFFLEAYETKKKADKCFKRSKDNTIFDFNN